MSRAISVLKSRECFGSQVNRHLCKNNNNYMMGKRYGLRKVDGSRTNRRSDRQPQPILHTKLIKIGMRPAAVPRVAEYYKCCSTNTRPTTTVEAEAQRQARVDNFTIGCCCLLPLLQCNRGGGSSIGSGGGCCGQ